MTTTARPRPKVGTSSAATNLRRGHVLLDTQLRAAPANNLPVDHCVDEPNVNGNNLAGDQNTAAAHASRVPGNPLGSDHVTHDPQLSVVAAELLFCAEFLDDCERVRIATENRLRSMNEAGVDAKPYEQQVDAFKNIEHQAVLALQRVVRRHPLGPWIKSQKGIGEKQGARLIAAIGEVAWRGPAIDRKTGEVIEPGRPRRGPAELWAYCGFVPGQKRKKGERSNWNTTAKMRAFLIAESCIRQMDSPFRADYDNARCKYVDAVHDAPCVRCGPKGKPAPVGSPLSDGHQHMRALRIVAKQVLKELFLEARRVGA